jgi:hypothetical protein
MPEGLGIPGGQDPDLDVGSRDWVGHTRGS